MYTYEPYYKTLKKRGIKQQELLNKKVINAVNANSIKNNKAITTDTIEKICNELDCHFSDIVDHVTKNQSEKEKLIEEITNTSANLSNELNKLNELLEQIKSYI